MNKEFTQFRTDVDGWVKEINKKVGGFDELASSLDENIDNTDHNYELITELRNEVLHLRRELESMKVMQVVLLRNEIAKTPKKQVQTV